MNLNTAIATPPTNHNVYYTAALNPRTKEFIFSIPLIYSWKGVFSKNLWFGKN